MPKLSKTRIINLNYNDGKRTIYNELFDYDNGKDALFSMENGVGKTVLIQFFLQPFIRNKRDLAGRKFEEYFTGNAPTYIIHEVLLDNGEKLLVGMIIKKDNSDDEKNKLRILAFTNRYSRPNDFDIVNIPFVDGKRILKFSEAEDKIKKYKSGKVNFNYYNFNDSSKKSQYFEDLRAYKINYKEWEDIIRSINNDESGLSNLYDKHKTDEALIRNVIVPLIESKINGEKNIIEAIRNNLGKYIESYKQSKESFHEIDLMKAFQGEMVPVTELLQEGIAKETSRENLYKVIYSIAYLCEEEFKKKCSEKSQCEEFISELYLELAKVNYEEHSLNYYNLCLKEEVAEEKFQEVSAKHKNVDIKHKDLVREKYSQESAELYEDLTNIESELVEVRERIENSHREDSEIVENINNYKFTLKNVYHVELDQLLEVEKELLETQKELKVSLQENEEKQKNINSEFRENIGSEAEAKNAVRIFEENEESFKVKYVDFDLIRNPLLNEYSAKELEKYGFCLAEKNDANIAKQQELTVEAASLMVNRDSIKKNIYDSTKDLTVQKITLEKKNNELNSFKKETAKIIEILRIKNLPLNVAVYKDKLKEVLKSENAKLKENLSNEQDKLRQIEDTINRYETGLIQLPSEVMRCFENKGIHFEYALNWLQNYRGSKEEKENLVKNNPFFPYGILLSTKDISLLKNESIDVYTSIPIPIINKGDLNKKLKIDKRNDILTIENQEFLLAFNYLLLDEEERAELLKNLRQKIKTLNYDIENIVKATYRNGEYEIVLAHYEYIGSENDAIEVDIKESEIAIVELETLLANCNEKAIANEKRRDDNTSEFHELQNNLRDLLQQKQNFSEFLVGHEEFKKYTNDLYVIRKHLESLKKKEVNLKEQYSKLQDKISNSRNEIYELKRTMKETSSKFEIYKNTYTGVLLKEDKNTIEARLSSCEKQLGENVKRDKEEERKLSENLNKIQSRLNRTVKEGNLSLEYKSISFSEDYLEKLKIDISVLEVQINVLKDEMNRFNNELSLVIQRKQREMEDIEKLGFEVPISKEDIKDSNFKVREKKIKEDLKENNEIIRDYIEDIDKLKRLKQKLEIYGSYSSEIVDVGFNFTNIQAATLATEEYISNYEDIKKEINNIEAKISKGISSIYEKYRDKNRLIKERLFDYLNKERKISRHSDIESLLEVVDRSVRTLELELSSIKSEEEVVINEVLRYASHVLQELRTIDKKSNIKHLGKTQKLLEITIPEEKEEATLTEYIKERVIYYGNFEGDYSNLLENDIQSAELISKLIGNINRIRVDIKKIEKTGLVRKSWKNALSQNSGGEKFVSMFILLSSLMSYMRKRETDIDNKEEKKIIIMDNPFAKTNAEHLLEPMFQIAEKYNIQLLCFSGIGGSAVYNRFNKIYVAKVVEDKFRNKENVSFKTGGEDTLELSDFTISKEQISLF
ncbi:hypothetical protein [Clostridium sp.]|uniref:hypothetical protein n=1 Tax=Clostridium sp. TaxID=1506 RepID=UPI003D6D66CE